ncbi:MAG: bifunctional folylpolyglutamate synthase/dihydrofolate synthase [Desulfotomaculales bacterium]
MQEADLISRLRTVAAAGLLPGLERVRELLAHVGNPQDNLRAAHIAGTNGKGSTAAMLASILTAAGYRTGLYTSPHLQRHAERFVVDGEPITDERLAALMESFLPRVRAFVAEGEPRPTEFELLTALAFLYFREARVDIAVVETGLGGRLDATNIIVPEVAVITNVSLDHTAYLGDSVASVAREKAGIIKPGVPVVTAAEGAALGVIRHRCETLGAPLYVVGKDIACWGESAGLTGQRITVRGLKQTYANLTIPLLGAHQRLNAACAVAAVEVLAERGFRITGEDITRGLAAVRWPGRCEVVRSSPLVLLDGAHNPAGAAALARFLRAHLSGRKITLILGILDDKDREGIVRTLVPLAGKVIVTRPSDTRAAGWRRVAVEARKHIAAVREEEDAGAAVKEALAGAGADDVILVTGSLYLVGAVRTKLLAVPGGAA